MKTYTRSQYDWWVQGKPVGVRIDCAVPGFTEPLTLDDTMIKEHSLIIDSNCTSSDDYEIGNVETSELTFILYNHDGRFNQYRFEGAILTLYLLFGKEPLLYGIYVVDEHPVREAEMVIRALDYMAKFDIPYKGDASPKSTVQGLIRYCCAKAGVLYDEKSFIGENVVVTNADAKDLDLSLRQLLGWSLGLVGLNAKITEQGHLALRTTQKEEEEFPCPVMDYTVGENPTAVKGLKYTESLKDEKGDETEKEHLVGDESYAIDISDNPLLVQDWDETLNLALGNIPSSEWIPVECLRCAPLPFVEPMDFVRIDGYPVFVTNHSFCPDGVSVIKSAGYGKKKRGFATGGCFTDHQKKIVNSVAERRASAYAVQVIRGYEKAVQDLNDSIIRSFGFYTTVQKNPETGQTIVYTHDQPKLEDSKYIERKDSAGQIAWTTDGWNDGNPVWQYGYTREGSLVMRLISTIGINADWVRLGDRSIVERLKKVQELETEITNMGIRISENTMIDGVPLSEKVASLTAEYLSIAKKINQLETGGTNLIMNPTFGSSTDPSGAWWTDGFVWETLTLRKIRWETLKLNGKEMTWDKVKEGDM